MAAATHHVTLPAVTLALALATSFAGTAHASVSSSAPSGFTVENTIEVGKPPTAVWNALVQSVGAWWHPDHTWSGDSDNLRIEPRAGGCFCEGLDGGGGVRHLAVEFVKPPTLLRMRGGLGPLQELAVAGSLTFALEALDQQRTRIRLTYTVGGYRGGGLDPLAPVVDSVLAMQLGRLGRYVATGDPNEHRNDTAEP